MSLDGFVLNALVAELNREYAGVRLEKIHQPYPHTLTILLGGKGKKQRMIASVDPMLPRFLISSEQYENPLTPPFFCLMLRKHIEGSRVESISMDGFERVIIITLEGRDELGNPATYKLMLEITGRHSNIVLTNPEGVIIDAIKRISLGLSSLRAILPGLKYELPPAQGRISPEDICGMDVYKRSTGVERALHHVLSDATQGLSQLLAKEICHRHGLLGTKAEAASLEQCNTLAQEINSLAAEVRFGNITGGYLYQGEKTFFHTYPLTHLCQSGERVDGVNKLISTALSVSSRNQQEDALRQRLKKIVHILLEKVERKVAALEQDIRASQERDLYKRYGELLYANIGTHRIESGEALVIDFYHEGLPEIRVPLDVKLSFMDNAKQYFKRYTRAINTEKHATERLAESGGLREYLAQLLTTIELAEETTTLREIELEMQEMGFITRSAQAKKANPGASGPMQFTSPDGLTVSVGRNNLQNDALVRAAHPDNLWFHVQKAPGSHVLIQATGPILDTTILFAANLAAYYSSQRASASVLVDYTERKNLRRPPKAKPGYVIYESQKTILVRRPQAPELGSLLSPTKN